MPKVFMVRTSSEESNFGCAVDINNNIIQNNCNNINIQNNHNIDNDFRSNKRSLSPFGEGSTKDRTLKRRKALATLNIHNPQKHTLGLNFLFHFLTCVVARLCRCLKMFVPIVENCRHRRLHFITCRHDTNVTQIIECGINR